MPKKKALTRKEVASICNKIIFSKYVDQLAKNVKRLQKEGRHSQAEMNNHMHFMQIDSSLTNLDIRLSKLSEQLGDLLNRILIQDYIIGRLSKAELIVSLRELYPNDPLSTTEHLENVDKQKDAFEDYIRTQHAGAVMCYHANENPVRCICAPTCYCKDHTCRSRRVPR